MTRVLLFLHCAYAQQEGNDIISELLIPINPASVKDELVSMADKQVEFMQARVDSGTGNFICGSSTCSGRLEDELANLGIDDWVSGGKELCDEATGASTGGKYEYVACQLFHQGNELYNMVLPYLSKTAVTAEADGYEPYEVWTLAMKYLTDSIEMEDAEAASAEQLPVLNNLNMVYKAEPGLSEDGGTDIDGNPSSIKGRFQEMTGSGTDSGLDGGVIGRILGQQKTSLENIKNSINNAVSLEEAKIREKADDYTTLILERVGSGAAGSATDGGSLFALLKDLSGYYRTAMENIVNTRRTDYVESDTKETLSDRMWTIRDDYKETRDNFLNALQKYAMMSKAVENRVAKYDRILARIGEKTEQRAGRKNTEQYKLWMKDLRTMQNAIALVQKQSVKTAMSDMAKIRREWEKSYQKSVSSWSKNLRNLVKDVTKKLSGAYRTELYATTMETNIDEAGKDYGTVDDVGTVADGLIEDLNTLVDETYSDMDGWVDDVDDLSQDTSDAVVADLEMYGEEQAEVLKDLQKAHNTELRKEKEAAWDVFNGEWNKLKDLDEDDDRKPLSTASLEGSLDELANILAMQSGGDAAAGDVDAFETMKSQHEDVMRRKLTTAVENVKAGIATGKNMYSASEMELSTLMTELNEVLAKKAATAETNLRREMGKDISLKQHVAEGVVDTDLNIETYEEVASHLAQKLAIMQGTTIPEAEAEVEQLKDAVLQEVAAQETQTETKLESADQLLTQRLEAITTYANRDFDAEEDTTAQKIEQQSQEAAEILKKDGDDFGVAMKEQADEDKAVQEKTDNNIQETTAQGQVLLQKQKEDAKQTAQVQEAADEAKAAATKENERLVKKVDDGVVAAKSLAQTGFDQEVKAVTEHVDAQSPLLTDSLQQAASGLETEFLGHLNTLKKHDKTSQDKFISFQKAYEKLTSEFTAEQLGATGAANALFEHLAESRKDLSASALASAKTDAEIGSLLESKGDRIGDMIDKSAEGLSDACVAQMHAEKEKALKLMEDVMKREDLTESEKQAMLEKIQNDLHAELDKLREEEAGNAQYAEKVEDTVSANTNAASEAITEEDVATQDAKATENSAVSQMGGDENEALGDSLSDVEKMTGILQDVEANTHVLLMSQKQGWAKRLDAVKDQMSDKLGSTLRNKADEVKEMSEQIGNHSERLASEIATAARTLDSNVKGMEEQLTAADSYIKAHKEAEDEEVTKLGEVVHETIEPPYKRLATELTDEYDEAHGMLVDLASAMYGLQHSRVANEHALKEIGDFEVHDADAIKGFIPKANELLHRHAAMAGWLAAYEAGDMAFKSAVSSKLGEYNKEIGMEDLEATKRKPAIDSSAADKALSDELSEGQKEMNAQLTAMYVENDKKIAAIRANNNLSKEEQDAMVAQIMADQQSRVQQLHMQEAASKQRQAQFESALAKFETQAAKAQAQAEEAIANGVASPEALKTTNMLASAAKDLARVRLSPLFRHMSLVQANGDPKNGKPATPEAGKQDNEPFTPVDRMEEAMEHVKALHEQNEEIEKRDEELEQKVQRLERVLNT